MSILITNFDPCNAEEWDQFCLNSYQGTFLHTRNFLSYHGERFIDRSLMLRDDKRLLGIIAAAEQPGDPECVVSHPGITYGGIVHQGRLTGSEMLDAFKSTLTKYRELGYKRFIYKAIPTFYHKIPAQDDVYSIFRLGGKLVRCDISTTIDLNSKISRSSRRKRCLNSAKKNGVVIDCGTNYLPELWTVVTENLMRKHSTAPVHSLSEMELLSKRFPENIKCVVALLNQTVVAGVILFTTEKTDHAQYIASSQTGYDVSALDAVFEYAINNAVVNNKSWFDFGISTEDQGRILNSGLYEFKTEFGGGGTVHQFYEFDLLKDFHAN